MTKSQDNHHKSSEHTSQESVPEYREENEQAAPASAAILNRLRIGRPSLLSEMDETQQLTALESAEWQVRVASVQRLESWEERAPIEHLIRALKDEHEAVRAAAAHALGILGNPEHIPRLVDALQDTTWLVRAAVVQALGMLGEQTPVEPLMLALHDEDESVRAVAARTIGTMGERIPIEHLLTALQDSSWQVREMAVLALGARGGHIPRSALTMALLDEDELVRRAAHFLKETYPDRFVETAAGNQQQASNTDQRVEYNGHIAIPPDLGQTNLLFHIEHERKPDDVEAQSLLEQEGKQREWGNDLLPQDDEAALPYAVQHRNLQRYPRKGALRILRLTLLACWSIFLGYVVSITWNLVQLTHADQAKLTVRFVVQALSAPLTALTGFNIPVWILGICMLLALLLFFGCLWSTKDIWKEYKWIHSQGASGEELEVGSGEHEQFTDAPVNPQQQISATRLFSRRAVLVGFTTVLIIGNGIAWSLLINSKRRQGSSSLGLGRVLYIYRKHRGSVRSVAWSPDGTRIVSGSDDKTIQVWDAANGGHNFTFSDLASSVLAIAWSPDGARIASGNSDGTTIRVWDASTGRNVFTYENTEIPNGAPSDYAVAAVAWSPDGRRIISANGDETIQVWDASASRNVFTYGVHADYKVTVAACSPDGKYVAFGIDDKTVQVWDASSGEHVYTYRGHYNALLGLITAIAWSPDGRRIASGSSDKTVQVWDAVNGENVYIYHGHSDTVTTIAWSPDGNYIASGSDDKTVQVWGAE